MYTEFNSQNVQKDPQIYVTEESPTPGNRIFSVIWKILLVIIVLIILFLGLIKFGVISLNSDIAPEAILLNQNEIGIKKGNGYQFVYTVLPENSTNKQVIWESSDPSVVRVNEVSGYAEALKNGNAIITVKTLINEKISECVVNVSDKNILVSNINVNEKYINLGVNYTTALSYQTLPSNATELNLNFSSSDSSVASVNSRGIITGHKEGSAIITVSSNNGSIKDTAYVTVYKQGVSTVVNGESIETQTYPSSINIIDEALNLMTGTTSQLNVNIKPENAPQNVTWSSSNSSVATVDSNGLVTARGIGTATIVAKTVNNLTDTCVVTVGNYSLKLKGIDITTNYTVLPIGITKHLVVAFNPSNATNKSITWSSSDSSIASVDQSGNVKTLKAGNVTITAKASDGGYTDTVSIEITGLDDAIDETSISFANSTYSIGVGETVPLSPIITPTNSSFKSVDFVSSDPSIATVDSNGVVRGIKAGTTTILATTMHNRLKASVTITVKIIPSTGVRLNNTNVALKINDTYTLVPTVTPSNASDKTVTFKSDNPSIATVDNNGIIRGISAGKTTITVTPNGGGPATTVVVTVA